MFRIRTIIAATAGALALAVPSTAGAVVPTHTPATPIDIGAGVASAPSRADIAAGLAPFQIGAQAAVDGWTAGANAAAAGWQMGLQGAAFGWQAGADALTGLQTQLQAGLPG